MIWSLDGDTTDGELVGAIHTGLAVPPDPTGTPAKTLYLPLVVSAK